MKYKLINKPSECFSTMEQILFNRGIDPKLFERYIKTTDAELFHYSLLDGIDIAAKTLLGHIEKGNKIFVQVDSDCDGYTSSAVLINYLNKVFPDFIDKNLFIRVHEGKEHGIIVDSIIDKGYSLVIIPDAGSNQYEEHQKLYEKGMDVIVLDHHLADEVSEYAMVVNNQLCDYPNKTLSGVGIVFKFIEQIDALLGIQESKNFLDLVSLGLLADMMDLRNLETKHLVAKGLTNIQNPFFKGLIERQAYSIGETITPIGVAFYIAPLINATIRVGTQSEKETMFKAMLNHLAHTKVPSTKRGCRGQEEFLVEQAVRNAINIRNKQKRLRDAGIASVEKTIETKNLNSNKIILAKVDDKLDKNLTGLVANQLMAKYKKPVLLVRQTDDMLQGSARGYDKSELKDLRGFLISSELMEYAEGHENAFGVGIKETNLDRLISYSNQALKDINFENSVYDVDFIFDNNTLRTSDVLDIASMKPLWGKGIEEAVIAITSIKVTGDNITLMSPDRNPTIKITLPNGASLIKFGASRDEFESLKPESGYYELDVLGTCSINEWQGNIYPQILVKDYEVVGSRKYYF